MARPDDGSGDQACSSPAAGNHATMAARTRGSATRDPLADAGLRRAGWRLAVASDRLLGIAAARRVATVAMRFEARDADGWVRGVHRVAAPRVRTRTPDLVHAPERWWSGAPLVAARRLGFDLGLDLRDNLQRVLFFTGRYEPAVSAFLRRELRRGDTMLDVGAHIGVHSLVAARRLLHAHGYAAVAELPLGNTLFTRR
jgi:hypothetical protein